jgi:hypothetical protein
MDGQPLRTGARRLIEMSDGAILMEDIVAYERPSRHRYRWTQGLRPPAKFLVSAGEAEWIFTERGASTRIDWSYTFDLTTPLVYPLALIMVSQFRGWMVQQLEAIAGALRDAG